MHKAGAVVHTPPTHDKVDEYLERFFTDLSARWPDESGERIAAFALWFVNWVHPFPNGNGRTARAFAYACLQLKLGFILPGDTTVIDLVMQNRDDYEAALKLADNAFETGSPPDLSGMEALVARLLEEQLSPFA